MTTAWILPFNYYFTEYCPMLLSDRIYIYLPIVNQYGQYSCYLLSKS